MPHVNEEQLRIFVQESPLAMAMFDREMRYLHASHRWLDDYQISGENLCGRSHYVVFPEIPETWKAVHRRGLAGETLRAEEDRFERADGSVQWIRWEVRPWYDTTGAVGGILIYSEDITQRKLVEESLRHKESLLAESQRIAHIGSWVADLPDMCLSWSEEAYRVYGVSPDNFALSVDALISLLHPDDVAGMQEWIRACLANEQPGVLEFRALRPDGSVRIMSGRGSLVHDQEGRPIRMVGTVQDITEQRQKEAVLRQRLDEIEQIYAYSPIGLFCIDRDYRFLRINERMAEIDGFSVAEHLTKTFDQIVPELADFLKNVYRPVFERGEPVLNVEIRGRTPKEPGKVRDWICNYFPLKSESGEVLGLIGAVLEVTERVLLQKQAAYAQKMQAIGQLTSGITHDFNNILGSILGYTEMALSHYVPDRDSKLAHYLNEVRRAGERARDLIASMLAFSRGGRGEVQRVDVVALINEVALLLHSALPSSIELVVMREAGPVVLNIDPVHLHQIILNLCINARDALGVHGRIEISLAHSDEARTLCASCHQEIQGQCMEIRVHDNGPGIAPDTLAHMFEPFYSTKEVGKGAGMGLSIVHGLMHGYGGHVAVSSTPDSGTTVRLLFPAAVQVQVSVRPLAAAMEPVVAAGGGAMILVVDDEQPLAQITGDVLEFHGYQAHVFTDSQAALAAFRAQPGRYAALVTDYTMPGLNGLDLAQAALGLRADLPVLLCSGYVDQMDILAVESVGVRSFLSKPVTSRLLLMTLETLLQNGSQD